MAAGFSLTGVQHNKYMDIGMCGFSVLCVSLSRSDPRARHPGQFPKSVHGVLWEGWRETSYGQKNTSSRTQNKGSRKYFREIVLQSLKTNVFDVMPKFYVRESQ